MEKSQFTFSKVVYFALKDIGEGLNTNYSLAKPNNKDIVVNVLRILHENGETFSPEEVKICLISEFRVPAKLAEEISEVARGIKQGKKYKVYMRYNNQAIGYWREKAESAQ